jgi:hypothetical protein
LTAWLYTYKEVKVENISRITLTAEKKRLEKKIFELRKGMDLLQDKTTVFAEHHQYMINTYVDLKDRIILAIKDSEDIGRGV